MPTLNDYRRQAGYSSVKKFAEAAQQAGVALRWTSYSPFIGKQEYENPFTLSIATQWLQGYYRDDIKPDDLSKLLNMLNIPEDQYSEIAEESRDAYMAKWREKHPPLTEEQRAQADAELKAWCEARVARMTDAEKAQLHQEAIRLGIARPERRSPIEIMIDRACGIE